MQSAAKQLLKKIVLKLPAAIAKKSPLAFSLASANLFVSPFLMSS
jgi:hypothetical protein